jgi:hypothetical protein
VVVAAAAGGRIPLVVVLLDSLVRQLAAMELATSKKLGGQGHHLEEEMPAGSGGAGP